jgi:hypothetical protein
MILEPNFVKPETATGREGYESEQLHPQEHHWYKQI